MAHQDALAQAREILAQLHTRLTPPPLPRLVDYGVIQVDFGPPAVTLDTLASLANAWAAVAVAERLDALLAQGESGTEQE